MEKVFLVLICFGFVAVLVAQDGIVCRENEEIDDCKNPCLPTCCEPDKKPCPTLNCTKGCVCKKGLIRNNVTGECIPPCACPKEIICGENEEIDKCKNPCLPSCCEPDRKPCPTLTCTKGCVCKEGLIRDETTGKCIPPCACPAGKKCPGEHEVYSNCTSYCPETCQTPCRDPVYCIQLCRRGCECEKGFIRDEVSGKCIPPERCPKCKCPDDKVYTTCGAGCVRTCQNISDPEFCATIKICKPGCICPDDLILDEDTGKCVKREDCKIEK